MIHRNFALVAILLFSPPAFAVAQDCAKEYYEISQSTADRVHDRFQAHRTNELNIFEKTRDWTRDFIMKWRGRYYPILAMDDVTPLKAKLFAKYSLGEKTAFDGAPFDIAKVKAELSGMITAAEKYPAEFNAFLQDTAMKAARLEGMERALAESNVGNSSIKISMPIIKMDAKGNLTEIGMKPLTWTNRAKFDLELKTLRQEMKQRLEGPGFLRSKKESYTLEILDADGKPIVFDAMDHIYSVKKVETYLSEFRDHLNRVAATREVTPDPELKALIDRGEAMYDNPNSLKKEFRPPYWAWKQLRWEQLKAELKAAALGVRVELWDKESTQTVVKFIKDMDPEERRALGLDKIAKTVEIGGKNFYVRTLWTLGGTLASGSSAAKFAIDFWRSIRDEAVQKETCASANSDEAFRKCAQTYLADKFTLESIKEVLFDEDAFLDNANKIKDPKVKAEVLDIFQRRLTYNKGVLSKEERKEALGKALKDMQSEKDPTSDAFREKIITAPRKELFLRNLVSDSDDQRTNSYLEALHPQQMKKNHDTVLKLLEEADPKARLPLLNELRAKGAEALAKDLEGLISDREDFMSDPEGYAARQNRIRNRPIKKKKVEDDKDNKDDPSAKDANSIKVDKKILPLERDDTN